MAEDIAPLGFSIDSSQAKQAADNLSLMAKAAQQSRRDADDFRTAAQNLNQTLLSLVQQQAETNRQLSAMSATQREIAQNTDHLSLKVADLAVKWGAVGVAMAGVVKWAGSSFNPVISVNEAWLTQLGKIKKELGEITAMQSGGRLNDLTSPGQMAQFAQNQDAARYLGVGPGTVQGYNQVLGSLSSVNYADAKQGLEQIKKALEGTSAEGAKLRRELQAIGMDLTSYSANSADHIKQVYSEAMLRNAEVSAKSIAYVRQAMDGTNLAGTRALETILGDKGGKRKEFEEPMALAELFAEMKKYKDGPGKNSIFKALLGTDDPVALKKFDESSGSYTRDDADRNRYGAEIQRREKRFQEGELADYLRPTENRSLTRIIAEAVGLGGGSNPQDEMRLMALRQQYNQQDARLQKNYEVGGFGETWRALGEGFGQAGTALKYGWEWGAQNLPGVASAFGRPDVDTSVNEDSRPESPEDIRLRVEQNLKLTSAYDAQAAALLKIKDVELALRTARNQGVITEDEFQWQSEQANRQAADAANPLLSMNRDLGDRLKTGGIVNNRQRLRVQLADQVADMRKSTRGITEESEEEYINKNMALLDQQFEKRLKTMDSQVEGAKKLAAATLEGGAAVKALNIQLAEQARIEEGMDPAQSRAIRIREEAMAIAETANSGNSLVRSLRDQLETSTRLIAVQGSGAGSYARMKAVLETELKIRDRIVDASQRQLVIGTQLAAQASQGVQAFGESIMGMQDASMGQGARVAAARRGGAAEQDTAAVQAVEAQAEATARQIAALTEQSYLTQESDPEGSAALKRQAEALIANTREMEKMGKSLALAATWSQRQAGGERAMGSARSSFSDATSAIAMNLSEPGSRYFGEGWEIGGALAADRAIRAGSANEGQRGGLDVSLQNASNAQRLGGISGRVYELRKGREQFSRLRAAAGATPAERRRLEAEASDDLEFDRMEGGLQEGLNRAINAGGENSEGAKNARSLLDTLQQMRKLLPGLTREAIAFQEGLAGEETLRGLKDQVELLQDERDLVGFNPKQAEREVAARQARRRVDREMPGADQKTKDAIVETSTLLVKQRQDWEDLKDIRGDFQDVWVQGAGGVTQTLREWSAGSKTFGEALKSIPSMLQDIIIQALILQPIMRTIQGFNVFSLFGGGSAAGAALGAAGTAGAEVGASVAGGAAATAFSAFELHDGGIVGSSGRPRSTSSSAFAGANRYHTGGTVGELGPGERAIVAKDGEEVLTEDNPRHRRNYQQGGGSKAAPRDVNVTINMNAQGGDQAQNADLAQQTARAMRAEVRALIGEEFRQQSRPGGVNNRR